jgi:methylated-DNA-[protein]-cysteine S-methyltransferase
MNQPGINPIHYAQFGSPLGPLLVTASDEAIHHILFDDMPQTLLLLNRRHELIENPGHPLLCLTRRQLDEYFAGQRQRFELPLAGQGTPYQQKVWRLLCDIPYAATWSYAQLAHQLGQPTAARAVGMANGKNPLAIVVPCHRVIGKNQTLTGYAGGLERKAWLLAHEATHLSA